MVKKIYLIIGVIILITLVICLSIFKKNNTANVISTKLYQSSNLFTDRDLKQNVDTSDAINYTVSDNNDIVIQSSGIYVISGSAKNVTIYVEAGDEDKVQIVLENLSITNETMPCIYVKTASKVFVTSIETNTLKVTGTFVADGSTNLNGVIFSKQDVTFNGTGTLNIDSTQNGLVGKDDLKITGGTYNITAQSVAVKANDSIRIADGTITLNAGTDGLHAENNSDDTKGYVYICGGQINIKAIDDCIHGQSVVQIDDGNISIDATGDGINAGSKSNSYSVTIEITGGTITIVMADGDTDGIDSNGDIIVTSGIIKVTGNSAFDYDGTATYNGGTIIINGVQVNSIPAKVSDNNTVKE